MDKYKKYHILCFSAASASSHLISNVFSSRPQSFFFFVPYRFTASQTESGLLFNYLLHQLNTAVKTILGSLSVNNSSTNLP
uniref:Uncharacterized protein n=1 Tax=Anguilla anguilla TaxID=7936 RepID=A0A0E9WGF5_ANGAN